MSKVVEKLISLTEAIKSLEEYESLEKAVSSWRDWEPSEDIKDEHKEEIDKLITEGYSEREAHRMAGAHNEHSDMNKAMRSGVAPSHMSSKMLEQLKSLASGWLDNSEKLAMASASPEVNPVKYAAGQISQAHDEHSKEYKKAYHDFLGSDDVKDLKGKDRHDKIKEWKNQWKTENPDYHQNLLTHVSGAHKQLGEAKQQAQMSLHDKIQHITTGGAHHEDTMSLAEAVQHVGGQVGEEGHTAGIKQDKITAFAQQNPDFAKLLSQEQMERKKRIDSAAKMKGIERQPSAPSAPAESAQPAQPKTVIRRRAKEQ